jgi:DNA-binding transcriptional LysR family regulator
VDPHLLRTFVTVVRLASFSAAATELGYTQAAVSQQIASLESDLKAVLLTRRPVTPTEAGARLLEHADPILLRLDAARADMARLASAPQGRLEVGLTPLAGVAVGAALTALRKRMPRLDVTIRVCSQSSVTTGVARGELDIGLVDGLAAPGDSLSLLAPLTGVGITESEVAVVLPSNHPLASRASVRLADLVDARWIDAPDVAPLADVRRVAGAEGFRAAMRYEGTDTLTLIALATAGQGLTLLPTWVATIGESVSIRVGDPPLVHRVEVVHGTLRDGSPAAELAGLL